MKKITLLLSVIFNLVVFAQPKQSSEKQEIGRILMNQKEAWNNGNMERYMEGYWKNDSLLFISKKGITRGWQATLANYKKSYPDRSSMGKLHFDILAIEFLHPNAAHVIGKWYLKRNEEKGDLSGHFSLIVKKINNRWVIVSDHSS